MPFLNCFKPKKREIINQEQYLPSSHTMQTGRDRANYFNDLGNVRNSKSSDESELAREENNLVSSQNLNPLSPNFDIDLIPKEGKHIFTFVDIREGGEFDTSNGNVDRQQITSDFEFPSLKLTDDAHHYLSQSERGNAFTGVLNIKSGDITVHPVKSKRIIQEPTGNGANVQQQAQMWESLWRTEFNGSYMNEGDEAIVHDQVNYIPGTEMRGVSHSKLIYKMNADPKDYVGFTVNDTRGILGMKGKISPIYGRSRTLNPAHFQKHPKWNAEEYASNKQTYNKNRMGSEFTYEMPIELKRMIGEAIVRGIDDSNPEFSDFLNTQLNSCRDLVLSNQLHTKYSDIIQPDSDSDSDSDSDIDEVALAAYMRNRMGRR